MASEIVFGQNMTSLTLHMSRCLGKKFKRGDEIVLSRMDHDSNVAPWLLLADEWFTRAELEVPGRGFYSQSWAQLENGVGLVRRFLEHSRRFLGRPKAAGFRGRKVLVLTVATVEKVSEMA